jgi:hypothetical protein
MSDDPAERFDFSRGVCVLCGITHKEFEDEPPAMHSETSLLMTIRQRPRR